MLKAHDAAASQRHPGWRVDWLKMWAVLGIAWIIFIVSVIGRWVTSDSFIPTDPGPDPLPDHVRIAIAVFQVAGPLGWAWIIWNWLVKPWRRTGQISIEGLMVVAWTVAYFQDPMMSYTVNHLTYNAHMVNYGAWTTGIFPGWTAPNTNHLAEPLILGFTAYVYTGFLPSILVAGLLRRIRLRWPHLNLWFGLLIGLLALMVLDASIEIPIIRLQLMSYPGAIRAISLWPGTQFQFPISESLLWGLFMMPTMLLFLLKADNGDSYIEIGSHQYKRGTAKLNVMRLLATIAFVQMTHLAFWSIPMQWFGTHGDAWPDMPSYMMNNICGEGTQYPCSGPGIPIFKSH